MAQVPTNDEIEIIKRKNREEIEAKALDQSAQGKPFNVPADGSGPGVIPEDVWKNLPGKTESEETNG